MYYYSVLFPFLALRAHQENSNIQPKYCHGSAIFFHGGAPARVLVNSVVIKIAADRDPL
jgi:hypothetical protein